MDGADDSDATAGGGLNAAGASTWRGATGDRGAVRTSAAAVSPDGEYPETGAIAGGGGGADVIVGVPPAAGMSGDAGRGDGPAGASERAGAAAA